MQNVEIGVVWVVRSHHLVERIQLPIIDFNKTMHLSCTVFEL